MIKNFPAFLAKKSILLITLFVFIISIAAKSQYEVTVGTGTATNTSTGYPCPLQDNFDGSRAQYLFRAAELKTAGLDSGFIYSISFNVTNLNGFSGEIDSLRVKMGTTTANALTATTWVAGATQVYAPTNFIPKLGKNTLVFTAPFDWNGTSNIVIEICNGSTANLNSQNVSVSQSAAVGFNCSHTYVADALGSLCAATTTTNTGTQTTRPNITFSWVPKLLCSGIPTIGLASANPTNVCFGQNLTLSVTGVQSAAGLEFQWEDSTTNTGIWSPIVGATTKTFVTTQDTVTYYRIRVKCTLTDDSAYSNIVTVTTPTLLNGAYTINKGITGPRNFQSFNLAYNAMKCGILGPVTFNVEPGSGPYTEQLLINGKIPNSSDINTITFNGNGEVLKFSSTNTNERAVIKLKNTRYFIFDSLRVDAIAAAPATNFGIGFQLLNDADSNIIRKCIVNASILNTGTTNTAGIVIGGTDASPIGTSATSLSDHNLVSGNIITGGYYGLVSCAGTGGENGNNTFFNNTVKDYYLSGAHLQGSYLTTFEQNRFSRPTRTSSGTIVNGIFVTLTNVGAQILRNRIFSPLISNSTSTATFNGINIVSATAGVSPSSDEEYKVFNNLVYDVQGAGPQFGLFNNGSSNIQFVNNTISLDDIASTSTATTKGYGQTGTANAITFGNNIISISRGGTGTKNCISIVTLPAFLDHNDYSMDAASGTNAIGFFGVNRLSLGDWQTATNNDASSFDIQPVFFLPGSSDTSDYHPTNAAMNNKGIALLPNDILLNVRPNSPDTSDIGCYEYTPPPCVPGSLNGVTKVTINSRKIIGDTTVCEGTEVRLGVKIVGPFGSAQTFQWEIVKDLADTPKDFGSSLLLPDTTFTTNDSSFYYRCKISCLGVDYFTDWRKINSLPAFIAGSYTIDNNMPISYIRGIVGGNFNRYDTAINAMRFCGVSGTGNVTFNVVPLSGPYAEQVKIDSIKGINVNKQIVFKGNNTILKFPAAAPTNTNERAVIKLSKADFITFDSLVIDANTTSAYGFGIQMLNNADSNTIKNCTILSNTTSNAATYMGIVINGNDAGTLTANNANCDGNIIDNNTISGGYTGIALTSGAAAALQLEYTEVKNNKILDFYNTGLSISGTSSIVVTGNLFSRPTRAIVGVGTGISFASNPSKGANVGKNKFTSFYGGATTGTTGMYGIHFNSVDALNGNENYVFNNIFYNLDGLGFVYPLYNTGSDGVFYYHNSIAIDNPSVVATGAAAGFYQTIVASNIVFKNNIIHITRGGIAAKHCIYLNAAATATTGFESNANDLYVDAASSNAHIGYLNGNKTTMKAWQNANSPQFDSLSFNYDPLFVNNLTGDLTPQFYLIDNQGQNLGIYDDILGTPRGATPDMGAFEFNAAVCPSPLLAGTATVTPSSGICLEVPVRLNLAGNSPLGQINFQWQDSIAGGNWQNLGPLKYSPIYDTISSVRNFYRCIVTCAATGASVTSSVAELTLNTIMPAGTYTIDSAKITDYTGIPGQNFQTFAEAISAMQCGILGSVVFDVQKGTFNEQVRVPYVAGTSATSTITFQGSGGIATDKILTWGGANAANNYVLRFDSCTYVTFKDVTIENTNTTSGRVVDFVVRASNDKLLNCIIKTPKTTVTPTVTSQAAIFSSPTKGVNLTIKGNTITGGSNGIYFTGTSGNATTVVATTGHLIDSNIISDNFGTGIFVQFASKLKVSRNTVTYNAPAALGTVALPTSGIYATYCDTAFSLINNKVEINNTSTPINGIRVENSRSIKATGFSYIDGNEVYANTANTGAISGLYVASSDGLEVKNNVIAINSAAAGPYGLVSFNNTGNINYYHNTVNISVASTTGVAAQLTQATTVSIKLLNNIFSNTGGGKAMYMSVIANFTSDYNMLYTTGASIVNAGTGVGTAYANINTWRTASNRDKWSIVYAPAFVSAQDLHPDIANENSWAMQGRAIQIKGNTADINGNYRPDSLEVGVPDLGAYEFFPSVLPPVLPSIPAVPTANTEQTFYFGSDTVMRISWKATPPPTAEVRRYSGVVGQYISAQAHYDSMYYYVSVDVPGNFATGVMKLYYLAPWLGSIPKVASEYQLGIAQTNLGGIWNVRCGSKNEIRKKTLYDSSSISYFSKFTGLYNQCILPAPVCGDTSNVGTEFWLAYPANQLAGGETYQLYLSTSADPANVTVSIPALNWYRNYTIGPNTVFVSDILPQAARHQASGQYCDGINITSDVPIGAYAHCWGSTSSGATMLMPTCTWGYDYKMLGYHQDWGGFSFSSYFVIAKEDNTKIAIDNTATPSGVPVSTEVVLNKGCWYQVLAASSTADLSGSFARSIPNDQGKCLPFAFFSGDTRTLNSKPCGGGGDFAISQNFPSSAWGKKYLTAPTSMSSAAWPYQSNLFRIALKDGNQVVKVNGTEIYPSPGTPPGVFRGFSKGVNIPGTTIPAYLEYLIDSASYIESTKPIMVCQFLSGACTGNGDPDMAFISPMEQGINKTSFYTNTVETITANVLTLIGDSIAPSGCEIPVPGTICNPFTWSKRYKHPYYPGKWVYIKHWPTAAKRQVTISANYVFTAITYGLGSVESYMYNAGTNIVSYFPPVDPPCNLGAAECPTYTCAGTQFSIKTKIATLYPDSIRFYTSNIAGIEPNKDFVLRKPYNSPPTYTVRYPSGDTVWTFALQNYFVIKQAGTYTLRMKLWSQEIEGCDKSTEWEQKIQVLPSPKIDFTYSPNVICPNTNVTFTADTMDATSGVLVKDWSWISNPYGIKQDSLKVNNYSFFYGNAGTDTVNLRVRTSDYCVGDTSHLVTINPNPVVTIIKDSINLCAGTNDSITINNPLVGATYSVYNTATGGTAITSGNGTTPFVLPNITSDTTFYIGCVSATGCVSEERKMVKATVTQIPLPIATPINDTACIGTNATFSVVKPNASTTYTWYNVATGSTALLTGNDYVNTVTADSTFYLEAVINGCVSISRFAVDIVAATPPALAVVSNVDTVCYGTTATFNIANPLPTVTYNWYTTATGGTATNDTAYVINNAAASASYFVSATSKFGCTTAPRLQVDLTVEALPIVDVVKDSFTVCAGNSVNYDIISPIAGATYNFYNSATSTTTIASGDGTTPFTFNNITANTEYYIECVTARGCVSATRKLVKVDAVAIPVAVASPAAKTVCVGDSITFAAQNVNSNTAYNWYNSATSTTPIFTGTAYTINPVITSGVYYLEATVGTCVSATRFAVSLTAATSPSVAVVKSPITVCNGDNAMFEVVTPDPTVVYNWYLLPNTGTATAGSNYTINAASANASYYVDATSANGCVSKPRLKVDLIVTQRPVVTVIAPTDVKVCKGTTQTFAIQNPVAGAIYNWYDASTSGTPIAPNTISFTTPAVNAAATYYVDGTNNGCTSFTKAAVTVAPLDVLAPTIVRATNNLNNEIVFDWDVVPNAASYQIAVNGGAYITPTSGSTGLTHTFKVTNIGDSAYATVKAIGTINSCQNSVSSIVWGATVKQSSYFPNSFSPNSNNPQNRNMMVCGSGIKEVRFVVFNQWGQKVWETTATTKDANGCYKLWDGTQWSVPQPSGVYMYTSRIVYVDNKTEDKTGSINLIR